MTVLLIIPAYNEGVRIGTVVKGIREAAPFLDVLVVDDGSRDETRARAMEAGARVVSHPFNLGYGAALQTGYKYALKAGCEAIVQMDGDGQHDPIFAGDLLEVIRRGEADVVIGSRFLGPAETKAGEVLYEATLMRRLGMGLFRTITSLIIGQRITDSTSGYQAMNRDVLKWVSTDKFPFDYPDADVIIMLHRAGFRVREVPVRMFQNQEKKSMHSGWKPLYYVFKMLLSILVTLMRR
jgi:glycosyltransferase involved in cell wall biosynthesis